MNERYAIDLMEQVLMSQNNYKWKTTISEVAHSIEHEYNEVV